MVYSNIHYNYALIWLLKEWKRTINVHTSLCCISSIPLQRYNQAIKNIHIQWPSSTRLWCTQICLMFSSGILLFIMFVHHNHIRYGPVTCHVGWMVIGFIQVEFQINILKGTSQSRVACQNIEVKHLFGGQHRMCALDSSVVKINPAEAQMGWYWNWELTPEFPSPVSRYDCNYC